MPYPSANGLDLEATAAMATSVPPRSISMNRLPKASSPQPTIGVDTGNISVEAADRNAKTLPLIPAGVAF